MRIDQDERDHPAQARAVRRAVLEPLDLGCEAVALARDRLEVLCTAGDVAHAAAPPSTAAASLAPRCSAKATTISAIPRNRHMNPAKNRISSARSSML